MLTLALTLSLALGADPSFVAGPVETVAEGFMFTEGPVWLSDGTLLFSDIPKDRIYRGDKSVYREPSGQSNGLTLDRQGRLLAAEHAGRRVSREEEDGSLTTIVDTYEGKKFNSPNDLVVREDGMIFFTDPPYGLKGGLEGDNAELDFSGVYAVMPGQPARLLAKDFDRPNGIALSPDEKILYVADTAARLIRAFDIAEDGTVSNDRHFCDVPGPDGIKVDKAGNVWSTCGDGVRIFSPEGDVLETIEFPAKPANCAFGGPDGKTLYVTARMGVYKVALTEPGITPASQVLSE